jgi:hypothetical protein
LLAAFALVGSTAVGGGCFSPAPYELRVYVVDAAECDEYEPALQAAIDWWGEAGVDAFVYGGCAEDEFPTSVAFFQPLEGNGRTDDLQDFDDHIPVYAVEEIRLDEERPDSEILSYPIVGASQHGVEPYCASLVAVTA